MYLIGMEMYGIHMRSLRANDGADIDGERLRFGIRGGCRVTARIVGRMSARARGSALVNGKGLTGSPWVEYDFWQ